MATSKWFDYSTYMANKLVQVKAADPAYTAVKLAAAFEAAGFAGPEGAERHFMLYGAAEDVAPNAFFNPTEYYYSKAALVFSKDPKAVTAAEAAYVKVGMANAGMNAWTHFKAYGSAEGANPSNGFSTTAYLEAKLAAMHGVDGTKNMTMAELKAGLQAAGISALEHFMMYGGSGAGEVADKYEGSIPSAFVVPEDQRVPSGGGVSGSTYTLTAAIDNASANVFNAPLGHVELSGQNLQTLNTGDTLNGTGQNPTLNAVLNQGNVTPTMTGVETLNLTSQGAFANGSAIAAGIDLSASTGVKHINSVNSLGDLAAYNVDTLVSSVGITNTKGTTTEVQFTKGALSGSEDTLTVNLNKAGIATSHAQLNLLVGNGNVAADTNGLEVLNFVTSGADSFVDLHLQTTRTTTGAAADSLGTIKVAGNKGLVLGNVAEAKNVHTVDASAMTEGGSLSLSLAGLAKGHKVTGSVGDDTITIMGTDGGLNAKDVIDLGAGTKDKLVIHSPAANTAKFEGLGTNITNVEILGVVSHGTTTDTTTFDSTKVKGLRGVELTAADASDVFVATVNNSVLTSVKDGMGVTLANGKSFGAVTVAVDGADTNGSDHLTLNIGNVATNTTAIDAGIVTINNIEELTLNVGDKANHTITQVKTDSLGKVHFTGGSAGADLKIGTGYSGSVDAKDVQAADFKGDLTLYGTSANKGLATQYVTFGAGDDTFYFSKGTANASVQDAANPVNVVTGGAGADTFVFDTEANTFVSNALPAGIKAGNFDLIKDIDFGGLGKNADMTNDIIKIDGTGATTTNLGRGGSGHNVVNNGKVVALDTDVYTTLTAALNAVVNHSTNKLSVVGGTTADGVDNAGGAGNNKVGLFSYEGTVYLVGEAGTSATGTYDADDNYIICLGTEAKGTFDAWDIQIGS